jgi:methylthioribose-1-phosphate isomerase
MVILDETGLPDKVVPIRVRDHHQAALAIREMRTRAFGQLLTVLYAMVIVIRRNSAKKNRELLSIMKDAANDLSSTRATFPIKEFMDQVLQAASEADANGEDVASATETRILRFIDRAQAMRMRRAELAADLIDDGDTVLTHCNISGEMVMIGNACKRLNKSVQFFATETRPYLQGARLTAWELSMEGFPVTLITDNAVAKVMAEGKINLVITGADRCAANGDIVNKIGTYQIALAAKEHHIPFYVLAKPSLNIKSGPDIPIEERDPMELLSYGGSRIAPAGVEAYYPCFDLTPAEYISKIVTFDGVFAPTALRAGLQGRI